MHIFVMRHGQAENLTVENAYKDELRQLTPVGHEHTLKAGQWIAQHYVSKIDLAMVSPYTRAQQSLHNIKEILHFDSVLQEPGITPSGRSEVIHEVIDASVTKHTNSLLLVSHMPFVGYLNSTLCHLGQAPLFSTAAIAVIDYDLSRSQGELLTLQQGFG